MPLVSKCRTLPPLGLLLLPALAQAADWNCQRNETTGEWRCASRKAATEPSAPRGEVPPSAPPVQSAPVEVTARPSPAPTVERPSPPPPTPQNRPIQDDETDGDDAEDDEAADAVAPPAAPATMEQYPPGQFALPDASATAEQPPPAADDSTAPKPSPRPRLDGTGRRVSEPLARSDSPAGSGSGRGAWQCRPVKGNGEKNWDCAETRASTASTPSSPVREADPTRSATLQSQDEIRFQALADALPANPWAAVCAGQRNKHPLDVFLLSGEEKRLREQSPLHVYSNQAEMIDNEISTFTGDAELIRADQRLWADFVSHNQAANTVNARGGVVYQEQGLSLASDSAFLDMDTNRHVFRNTQFILQAGPARGTSRETRFESQDVSRYDKFTYTACPPGNRDWLLHADTVRIDKASGRGSARNAWFEFKGVPLFYSPYLSFPTDDRRQSGFLNPAFGTTKVGGFDLMVPYYFNLAPNYDMTFAPRLLTRRGLLLRDEFRYLTSYGQGRILAEVLPDDAVRGESRGQAGWLNESQFGSHVRSHIDANYVSDERYLNDLGNPLNIVDYRYVRSNAYTSYSGAHFDARAAVDYFQTIDPTILRANRPYYHLPQFTMNYRHGIANTGLHFDGLLDIANFSHDDDTRVVGQRLNLKPRLSWPIQSTEGFFTPSIGVQHTQYLLENQAPGLDNDMGRTLPIASVDSGLYFERDFNLDKTPWVQTLEPRLYYLYVPYTDQKDLPVFDTTEYDFTFYQLFRENRFTNPDRYSDANQVTAALTSRFIDESTGLERLRTSLGKIVYFETPRVSLAQTLPPALVRENIIADVYSRLSQRWSFRSSGQWNTERERIDRGQIALQFDDRNNNLLNLAYRFRRNQNQDSTSLDLTDVSFRIPVIQQWHLIGRWQYSLLDDRTLESFLGFERETCCWRFTLLGRHYLNGITNAQTGNNTSNTGLFMQLELKGLTRLGDQVDQFLQRSISGYRYEDD